MTPNLFVATLAAALALLFTWAFRTLPGERWQILAAVPTRRTPSGRWRGANLTFYGLLLASACTLAAALFLLLLGSVGVPRTTSLELAAAILAVGLVAAKLLARLVERKKHTLTVGGGAFAGLLAAPVAVAVLDGGEGRLALAPVLAALAIAHLLGEGVGRLACISFGCCYGRPLSQLAPWARRLFGYRGFTFHGGTRKIAYASGLEGVGVIPVQAVTAVVYALAGLAAMLLFFAGCHLAAFLLAAACGQLWRAFSETLRADERGGGRVSAYQVMAVLAFLFSLALLRLAPAAGPAEGVRLGQGLAVLWSPGTILLLELLWAAVFLAAGWSKVTGSRLTFFVYKSRV